MYSFSVTFNLRPESLSPILNKESPKRSQSRCNKVRSDKLAIYETYVESTYLELPLLHATPCVCDSCDDAWFVSFLVALNELFDSQVVDINSLNRVCESLWIINF